VKYRTTCPRCASVFRLGPEQLEAAAGWVQCGVCGAPFDAFPALLQEDGSPLQLPAEAPPTAISPPIEPLVTTETGGPAEPAIPDVPPETATVVEPPSPTPSPVGIAQREAAEELPSIILVDPDQTADEDIGPLPEIALQPSMPPAYPPLRPPEPVTPPAPSAIPASPAGKVEYARPKPPEHWSETDISPPRRRAGTLAWAAASVLLLVTLLGQAAYFLRDTLASELPQTRPALEQACALLGCTLGLPRQLDQLRIVGSDLQTEATERLRLTLTLGNRADQPQAWPMLVLTLTDQNNRPLARRSFAPSEYLGDAARIAAGIPPRSEHPLNLPLSVRNIRPMGFDLRLTY
jgi:predicted Zn finger-like uncharacterized protein